MRSNLDDRGILLCFNQSCCREWTCRNAIHGTDHKWKKTVQLNKIKFDVAEHSSQILKRTDKQSDRIVSHSCPLTLSSFWARRCTDCPLMFSYCIVKLLHPRLEYNSHNQHSIVYKSKLCTIDFMYCW